MVTEPGRCCRRDLPSRHFPPPLPARSPPHPPRRGAARLGSLRLGSPFCAGGGGRREDGGGGSRRWLPRHVQQEIMKLSVDVAAVCTWRKLLSQKRVQGRQHTLNDRKPWLRQSNVKVLTVQVVMYRTYCSEGTCSIMLTTASGDLARTFRNRKGTVWWCQVLFVLRCI
ncbi:uncharacterized protein PRD47_004800 isoform 1-T1 [Ara ararauna]